MEAPSATVIVNFILGVFTVAATVLSIYLARRKREETKQQAIKQEFDQQNVTFDQISNLADMYKQDAEDARAREAKVRAEWEARWDRQMDRCRKITDSSAAAIAKLQQQVLTPAQREQSERDMDAIQQHRDNDHRA